MQSAQIWPMQVTKEEMSLETLYQKVEHMSKRFPHFLEERNNTKRVTL